MKLESWLRQERSLDERLGVVERLCQAVNEVHDRGEALAALEPSRIEVGAAGHCDLSPARRGSAGSAYTAPDREGGAPLAAADVYAAGAIAWEVLAGRAPRRPPRPLGEVRPDLPRELTAAVMACLERSAEWRPKDLTYLAQMAAVRQKKASRPTDTPRAPLPPRIPTPRTSGHRPSRRTWPLLAAFAVVLGLAVVAGRHFLAPRGVVVPAPAPSPTPEATAASAPAPARAETPGPVPTSLPTPFPAAPTPAPSPTPVETRAPQLVSGAPPAPPDPTSEPRPTARPEEVRTPEPAPRPEGGRLETRPKAPAGPPGPPPTAEPVLPGPPAALTAVSPLEVKRPGKILIDLHGRGFGPHHRARVLPVKKAPWGITIVRQKRIDDSLITILVDLDEATEAGEYALAVEDGRGARTEPLVFTVTR